MQMIKFNCVGVAHLEETCDQFIVVDEIEATYLSDGYICPDCLNQEEMYLYGWSDSSDDAYALTSVGWGSDEDY